MEYWYNDNKPNKKGFVLFYKCNHGSKVIMFNCLDKYFDTHYYNWHEQDSFKDEHD